MTYSKFTLLQLVLDGKRPVIPGGVPAPMVELINACWAPDPSSRPGFSQIVHKLMEMEMETEMGMGTEAEMDISMRVVGNVGTDVGTSADMAVADEDADARKK